MTVQLELMSPSICTQIMADDCIEYVRLLQWPKENPFGEDVPIDSDNPNHTKWIVEKALQRSFDGIDTLDFFFLSPLLLFLFLFHDLSSNTIHDITYYIVERGGKGMIWKKKRGDDGSISVIERVILF